MAKLVDASSICPEHVRRASRLAMLRAYATRICTDGRTDGLTKTHAHVTSKSLRSDTCARIQKFRSIALGKTRSLMRREVDA